MSFKKGLNVSNSVDTIGEILDVEWSPLETDTVEFNKHSLKDLDKVLDDMLPLTPEMQKKLEIIIKATK